MFLQEFLTSICADIAASKVIELVKKYSSPVELKEALVSEMNIQDANIKAENIIQFLANNGNIHITGTNISSPQSISMQTQRDTHLFFGNGSTSRTNTTLIHAGQGASIVASGGARIQQTEDGSIIFST